VTSSSSHSLLTYPSSSLPFQRQTCEACNDQWIVLRVMKNCDRYTKPVNKLCCETHISLMLQHKMKILTFHESLRGVSNMQSQCTSVEQSLLNQLERPLCMQYMRLPITLCKWS
jgi:dolichyl-phosphate-mannose--protein O-mannosyl transferase